MVRSFVKAGILFFIVTYAGFIHGHIPTSAVTYTFSGGRLGDNLLAYCHAKWISYIYNIPLLYKPFDYSDQLVMDIVEIRYTSSLEQQFKKTVTYSEVDGKIDPDSGYLYVIPFFPESIFNRQDTEFPYLFSVDWQDPQFKQILKKLICPFAPIQTPFLPKDCLSVAIHVRRGTGWDIPNYQITPEALIASHPLRFAPDSFYIEQLKKITRLFSSQTIYVYLFTDHNDPGQLAQKYKKAINDDRMIIDYRTNVNNEFVNVIDDFFALTKFDCLIRPDSNFSFIASKLADYKILISPWHGSVHGEDINIDEINFEVDGVSFVVTE